MVYVITREDTGKVKRIRQNPKVKLTLCTFKGNPIGEWISGDATKVTGEEAQVAINLRKKKYGFMAIIAGFVSRGKGDLVVFSIKLDL